MAISAAQIAITGDYPSLKAVFAAKGIDPHRSQPIGPIAPLKGAAATGGEEDIQEQQDSADTLSLNPGGRSIKTRIVTLIKQDINRAMEMVQTLANENRELFMAIADDVIEALQGYEYGKDAQYVADLAAYSIDYSADVSAKPASVEAEGKMVANDHMHSAPPVQVWTFG